MNANCSPEIVDLNFQGTPGVIATYLLKRGDELGLFETGPTSTLPTLLSAIEAHGGLGCLRFIAVSHIHLDHAGAAGKLLSMAPHVRCYVHSIGRRHLVDPSRLLRSATMIYGDRMDSLWGEVVPCPEDRVIGVEDGDTVTLGGTNLEVLYTPGHAIHHMALFDRTTGRLYTGDVAGVRLQGMEQVRPPTPPPDLDPAAWKESVARLRALQPSEICLTHFGRFATDIDRHFEDLLTRLDAWIELVRGAEDVGQDAPAIVDALQQLGDGEVMDGGGTAFTLRQYDLATPWGMTVDGILHYLRKQADRTRE